MDCTRRLSCCVEKNKRQEDYCPFLDPWKNLIVKDDKPSITATLTSQGCVSWGQHQEQFTTETLNINVFSPTGPPLLAPLAPTHFYPLSISLSILLLFPLTLNIYS